MVTFTKAAQAGDKTLYKTRLFVGADTLVHRLTVTDGVGVLLNDIGLRAVRVNAPLLPSSFTYTPLPVLPPPARPAAPALLPVGADAPDFTLAGGWGKPVSLAGLRGKTVILDSWAIWCRPCLASLPNLDRVAARRAPGGVALAVNVSDTRAAFDGWVPRHPQYGAVRSAIDPRADGKDVATVLYHVSVLPTQYVIGPQGKVVASFVGFNPSTKDLEDALNRAAK